MSKRKDAAAARVERLKRLLNQAKIEERKIEARDRAKEQRALDRRNLLLGRALAQTGQANYFKSLRGAIGKRKSQLTDLNEQDYENLMAYFEELIKERPEPSS